MSSDQFVSAISQMASGLVKCLEEILIGWVVPTAFEPVGPVTGNWVRVAARDSSIRRSLPILGIVPLIEFAILNHATGAVPLDGGNAITIENPFHAGCYLLCHPDDFVIFKFTNK